MQEVVGKKRRNIRTLSMREKDPSYEVIFNSYNCAWMHRHFRDLLGHLLTVHPTPVKKEVIKDMLVCSILSS